MTQVDFYILRSDQTRDRLVFCTRLSEKALQNGLQVVVLLPSPATLEQLSDLLWHARPESFLPHAREADASCPIWLAHAGDDLPPPPKPALLINLSPDFEPKHPKFDRIAEVVIQDEAVLGQTRALYTRYKACGLAPTTHNI